MIDYSIAVEFADQVRAFAIIESQERPYATGDDGQAFGLLQMHPDTFKRYYGCAGRFPAGVKDTWTEAQIKACAGFLLMHDWQHANQAMRDKIVVAWNLGEAAVFLEKRTNEAYLARWKVAYAKIQES